MKALAVGMLLGTAGPGGAQPAWAADVQELGGAALDLRYAGPFTGVQVATGQAGNSDLGEVGAQSLGLRSGDGSWLARWDGLIAGRGGYLAMGGPAPLLLGWRVRLEGELGRRFTPERAWSLYLGAQGMLRLQYLEPSRGGTSTLNDMDIAEGLHSAGGARLGAGVSYLEGTRSLLLEAFVQGARRPTVESADATFVEGGLAARLDLGSRLATSLEASWGNTGIRHDWALGSTDRTTHEELDAAIRVGLWRGAWVGIEGGASRDSDRIVYTATGTSFPTANPPNMRLGLTFGTWLWH